jgi:rubrerythrin
MATGEVAITLPSGTRIKLTVPSTGRELEVKKMLDSEKKQLKTERNYIITGRLLTVIGAVEVEGKELRSLKEIRDWMRAGTGLSIIDSRYIQKMAKEIDVKINTAKTFVCKHCGYVEEDVALPMTIYFFWPEYQEV